MKRVTAFMGTAQKHATYQAIREFEKNLKQYEDIDFEYVFLSDYRLEFCVGCKVCFDKGEALCPLKDDRDVLLEKLEQSDGVIFATPSYAFQVSARMKNLLDRTAFVFHRPRFFGKVCMAIVTQGVPIPARNIRKYLESSGENLGFSVVKGSCLWTLAPMSERQQDQMRKEMKKASLRFYKGLLRPSPAAPSLFRLMLFRLTRTGLKNARAKLFDYSYFQEKGWFGSDYYYKTTLGPIKKLAGHLFDFAGSRLF